jgi:hypothetical protein
MQCYTPMTAYRDSDNQIIFSYKPNVISELKLPCGQCIGCRLNHAENWAIRMVHEAQMHEENSFITLTYDENNLPENESLHYPDVTRFLKRLRKALSKTPYKGKIKYYRVGEYGDENSRPHYHIILFGFDFTYKIRYKGLENEKIHWRSNGDRKYYISSFLNALWDRGHAELGDVDYATCMYVAKYVTKKVTGKEKEAHYGDKEPEKAAMSKKEPIGHSWLKKFSSDVYNTDSVILDAKRFRVPKSYDTWLEKNDPALYDEIKIAREENSKYIDQEELTLKHRVKLHNMRDQTREFDTTAPITQKEKLRVEYMKNMMENHHKRRKK